MTAHSREREFELLFHTPALHSAAPPQIGALLTLLSIGLLSLQTEAREGLLAPFIAGSWEPARVGSRLQQLDERLRTFSESEREEAYESALERFAVFPRRDLVFALVRVGCGPSSEALSKPLRVYLERLSARLGVPSATRLEVLDQPEVFLRRLEGSTE